jgi:beta-lactamase class A
MRPLALLALCLLALLAAAVAPASAATSHRCLVPGVGKPLDAVWHPRMTAAIGYNDTRRGDIAFAVRTDHRFYGYRPDHVEWSASVVKAMLMVAYLDRPQVAARDLTAYDRSLLDPMITLSDNTAASRVDAIVGDGGLDALGARIGMTHFRAVSPIWGETQITAADQTRFFLHIDSYIVPRHRAYAMHLLASIVPSERWGIGEVAPKGWRLYFKGGWGYGTGLLDHQVVLLTRGCARVAIAVLTMHDGSHAYGKESLKGIFARLLRGLPTGAGRRRAAHGPPASGRPALLAAAERNRNRPSAADHRGAQQAARHPGGGFDPPVQLRPAR